ncbi:MAG TPA: class I SAM-dependent methyltransferase [Bryobacteraceae bacterium]|nr:class I SAM-dependent methyltransferase [Bryobacteraceae bacterium]
MPGISLSYLLKHPVTAVASVAADPVEVWIKFEEKYADWRAGRKPASNPYDSDAEWEPRLHRRLGLDWPCPSGAEFREHWPRVIQELEAEGIHAGPGSFRTYNDGDAGLTRGIWCLVRHLKPERVVETGVAHGVTSRFILDALALNGHGHLWSIDLPPLEEDWRKQVGVAVGSRHKDRWTYINGSSRRRLPGLLSQLGRIDLFIHDSLHSQRNVLFELERAWAAVRPGGAIVVDDVDVNHAFPLFTRGMPSDQFMICEAEPITPDVRRFNHKGLFGIIFKD